MLCISLAEQSAKEKLGERNSCPGGETIIEVDDRKLTFPPTLAKTVPQNME